MKSTAEVYKLARGETELRIDDECSRSLRLSENSVLYVVGLVESEEATENTVFVASPYPTSSWNNLFRASFMLKLGSGTLHALITRLNELWIFCRSVEVTGSLPLQNFGFLSHTLPRARVLDGAKAETMVPATVMLVLEVPEPSMVEAAIAARAGKRSDAEWDELRRLHAAIRAMLEWQPVVAHPPHPGNGEAVAGQGVGRDVPSAREALQRSLGDRGIVEWTSALRTVREISRLWKDPRLSLVKTTLQEHKGGQAPELAMLLDAVDAELTRKIAERGLEKTRAVVRRDGRGLYIDAVEWRADIWQSNRDFRDSGHTARVRTADKVVIVHADSDEKILYWSVRSLHERCIVSFSVTFPAGGMESAWCAWITRVIHERGGGIILSAQLSARAEPESDRLQIRGGRWASLRLTVEFRGVDNNAKAQQIIQCFIELQGKERAWEDSMQQFLETHRYIKDLLPAPERRTRAGETPRWRAGTLVSHVMLWSEQHLDALHRIEFWPWSNPFNFTAPYRFADVAQVSVPPGMDRWGQKMLQERGGGLSRDTLVRRIVEELHRSGRVAIVGAHRSGKTSIVRHVANELRKRPAGKMIPVQIDAGVCPPVQLCVAILREIYEPGPAGHEEATPTRSPDEKLLLEAAKQEVELLEPNLAALEQMLARLSPEYRGPNAAGPLGQRDKFLRDSRDALRRLLKLKFGGQQPHIVVMVDGISDHGPWTEPWAQAFWRELVEAQDLSELSWVLSTSHPLGETMPNSNISSVFREYNLEPLDEYETDLLINLIDTPPVAGGVETPALQLPVLTLSARRFLAWVSARMPYLLQVCCHCLFERAKRMRVPLLCMRVAIEVLDGEVLPQITDYLEGEWGRLPDEARRYVRAALAPWPEDPRRMLFAKAGAGSAQFAEAPPPVQKALLRSGLTGAHEFGLIAPLVAFWLRRSGRHLA